MVGKAERTAAQGPAVRVYLVSSAVRWPRRPGRGHLLRVAGIVDVVRASTGDVVEGAQRLLLLEVKIALGAGQVEQQEGRSQ